MALPRLARVRMRIVLTALLGLASPDSLRAEAPPAQPAPAEPPSAQAGPGSDAQAIAARLEANVARGVFAVFDGPRDTYVVIGEALDAYGAGAPRMLAARGDLVVGKPLAPAHPPSLDTLAGRGVRLAGPRRTCEATLGAPVVIRVMDSSVHDWARSLEVPRSGVSPAVFVWNADWTTPFVIAPIVGTCRGAKVATTRLEGQAREYPHARASRGQLRPYLDAFAQTDQRARARRAAASLGTGPGRRSTVARLYPLGTGDELVHVYDEVPDGCVLSSYFPIFYRRVGDSLTEIRVPGYGDVEGVFDVDGDGTLEIVFAHGEWYRTVMQLAPGATSLHEVGEFRISASMGC